MKLTYYGHSCFLMETNRKKLLFDPFITGNLLAKHIDLKSIQADYILLSHGHGDHVADAETIAKNNSATIISNYEIVTWYEQKGIAGHPMNIGGKWAFDFGTVKCVNAVHSSVLPDGTYGGNPFGFVIWNKETCFYFAGDTGLAMDMKLLPLTCPKLDFAILPIGDNFTMGWEDALMAAGFIDCEVVVGSHFDTFGFIKIDREAAITGFAKRRKKLILPAIGEMVEV